jgi:hypothetical protein
MSKEQGTLIDFADREQKLKVLSKLGALSGRYLLSVRPYKPKRSLRANAYYHAAVVPAFREFMREHGQFFEPEECHEFFLQKFSSKNVIDPETGEVLAVIGRRSSKMDSGQFSEFVNTVIGWLQDRCGVIVPEPEYA